MVLVIVASALLSQTAAKPSAHRCPADFLELADWIGELREAYPEFKEFVAREAFQPGYPKWPSIVFERGVTRVPVAGHPGRKKTVLRGRYPIALDVGFIPPVEIESVSLSPMGRTLGWYYVVSVEARDKPRRNLIFSDVMALLQSYERCPQSGVDATDATVGKQ